VQELVDLNYHNIWHEDDTDRDLDNEIIQAPYAVSFSLPLGRVSQVDPFITIEEKPSRVKNIYQVRAVILNTGGHYIVALKEKTDASWTIHDDDKIQPNAMLNSRQAIIVSYQLLFSTPAAGGP